MLLPPLPPPASREIEIPESMHPDDRKLLISELGNISASIASIEARDEEHRKALEQRFRAIDARTAKLETSLEETGRHDVAKLQRALRKREDSADKWKWWVLSLVASAIVGLVTYYIATR